MAAGSLGLLGATPQAGEHGGRQPTAGPGSRQGLRQAAVTFAAVLAALLAQAAAFATLTAHAAAGAAALAAAVALLLRAAADMPQGPLASPQACEHAPLRSRGSSDAGVIVEVTAARPAAAGKAGCQATATAAPPAGASPAETQAAAARAPGTALTSSTGMRAYAEAVAAGEHAAQVAEAGPDAALCSPCSSASGSLSSAAAGLSAAPAPSSHALAQPVSAAAAAVAATAAASVPAHCPLRPLPAAAGAAAAGQQPRAPTLVSDPEPEWLNADVKQRFIQGKSSLKASADQAALTHAWRRQLGVDGLLRAPPGGWFEFVIDNFTMHIIGVADNGDMSLLVRLSEIRRLTDAMRAGKGTLHDLELHLAFINQYLFTALPGGMQYLVVDCAGARLSMISSDAIAAFRVFASMGLYYPERLGRVVVVNAPRWVDMPWRVAQSILDENTRAKVVLDFDKARTLRELERVFGTGKVPVNLGGTCTEPTSESPEMARLLTFVADLRAGGSGAEAGVGGKAGSGGSAASGGT